MAIGPGMTRLTLIFTMLVLIAGCSSTTPTPAGDAPSASSHEVLVTEGRQRASVCVSCHGADLSGSREPIQGVYAPNLTPDVESGIGSWSDEQVIAAIRTGVDDQGASLCTTMPRFATLSDEAAQSLVAYLRSVDPVSRATPQGECADP